MPLKPINTGNIWRKLKELMECYPLETIKEDEPIPSKPIIICHAPDCGRWYFPPGDRYTCSRGHHFCETCFRALLDNRDESLWNMVLIYYDIPLENTTNLTYCGFSNEEGADFGPLDAAYEELPELVEKRVQDLERYRGMCLRLVSDRPVTGLAMRWKCLRSEEKVMDDSAEKADEQTEMEVADGEEESQSEVDLKLKEDDLDPVLRKWAEEDIKQFKLCEQKKMPAHALRFRRRTQFKASSESATATRLQFNEQTFAGIPVTYYPVLFKQCQCQLNSEFCIKYPHPDARYMCPRGHWYCEPCFHYRWNCEHDPNLLLKYALQEFGFPVNDEEAIYCGYRYDSRHVDKLALRGSGYGKLPEGDMESPSDEEKLLEREQKSSCCFRLMTQLTEPDSFYLLLWNKYNQVKRELEEEIQPEPPSDGE